MHHTGMHGAAAGERTGARPSGVANMGNFLKPTRTFEVLWKKRRVNPQLHIFLGAEFLAESV
jgi:hypothetical protein